MKSIDKATSRELKQFLQSTIQSQQDRKWNESDLKIKGFNMGYPDHLKNLTFAQHQAIMQLSVEEEEAKPAVFKDEGTQQNLAPGASNFGESQKDLNADLLLQNIYRSEEFFDPAQIHNMSVPHLNSGESMAKNPGRETEVYAKHKDSTNSNVILPTQFDENSELADEVAEKKNEMV